VGTVTEGRAIREARESDIPSITEIYNQAVAERIATCDLSDVPEDKRAEWLRRHRAPYGVWVAEDGARVLGWVALSPYDTKPCFHRTATFATYVDRSARGSGVGTLLRTTMIAEARKRGFHALVNRVWADNEASIALALRFGFRQVGHFAELVDLDGRYLDCLFFELLL
jgi:phosphinothricin acetyltransferase